VNLSRRSLITGLVSFVAAPAIVRVSSLMPVKAWGGYEIDLRPGAINWADAEYDARMMEAIYRKEMDSAFEDLRPVIIQDIIVQASDARFEIVPQS
jgi:hypothetical protein